MQQGGAVDVGDAGFGLLDRGPLVLLDALGAPAGLGWHDAEVARDSAGRPCFELRGTVARAASDLGVRRVHLSLSHDAGVATAFVVLEGEPA